MGVRGDPPATGSPAASPSIMEAVMEACWADWAHSGLIDDQGGQLKIRESTQMSLTFILLSNVGFQKLLRTFPTRFYL